MLRIIAASLVSPLDGFIAKSDPGIEVLMQAIQSARGFRPGGGLKSGAED